MKQIGAFLRSLLANPKTSALGIAGLMSVAIAAWHDINTLANPATIVGALTSAGLLFAPDARR